MSILITRPFPGGDALVNQLNQQGYDAYHYPLIAISEGKDLPFIQSKLDKLNAHDLIIALSPNVIYSCTTRKIHWPEQTDYFAIGQSSATLLAKLTGQVVYYPTANEISETFLLLPQLEQVNAKQVLILRGNAGRSLIPDTLKKRGAVVECCECYCRQPINYNQKTVVDWQKKNIHCIVVTSNELLTYLIKLVLPKYLDWLMNCQLIVVSERTANYAISAGWRATKITIAKAANNIALIEAIDSLAYC